MGVTWIPFQGVAQSAWDIYVASLSPYAWWKLDEDVFAVEGDVIVDDASGNGRTAVYAENTNPTRHESPLVDGSVYSVTPTVNLVSGVSQASSSILGLLAGGSFTFGFWIATTATCQQADFVRGSVNYFWIGLNHTWFPYGAASGKVSFYASTSGLDADGLSTADIGFNDGNPHLLMFEYDSSADTISIWFDGTEVATRSHAGITMPTGHTSSRYMTNLVATIDEYLFFDRVLTGTEHTTLASFAAP